jgi:hypothetical protein
MLATRILGEKIEELLALEDLSDYVVVFGGFVEFVDLEDVGVV